MLIGDVDASVLGKAQDIAVKTNQSSPLRLPLIPNTIAMLLDQNTTCCEFAAAAVAAARVLGPGACDRSV